MVICITLNSIIIIRNTVEFSSVPNRVKNHVDIDLHANKHDEDHTHLKIILWTSIQQSTYCFSLLHQMKT